jgi:hypothetical protein
MGDIVPRKTLVKQALQGAGGIVGGIALIALSGLGGIAGWIVGGVIAALGLLLSTSKDDRVPGLIVAGAGALTLIAQIPFIRGVASFLMTISGIGLIGAGIFSLFMFFRNLKSRS